MRAAVDVDGNVIITDGHRIRKIVSAPDAAAGVGLGAPRGTFDRRLAVCRKRLGLAESERACRQARHDQLTAELAVAATALADSVTARDKEAVSLRELEAKVCSFRNRVATEGVDELNELEVY